MASNRRREIKSWRRKTVGVESSQEAGRERKYLSRPRTLCRTARASASVASDNRGEEGLISHTLPEMPTFFVRLDMLTGGRDHLVLISRSGRRWSAGRF